MKENRGKKEKEKKKRKEKSEKGKESGAKVRRRKHKAFDMTQNMHCIALHFTLSRDKRVKRLKTEWSKEINKSRKKCWKRE